MQKRIHASEIKKKIGEKAELCGWVHEIRDLGKIKFIVLRDISGIAQITAPKADVDEKVFRKISEITRESVIRVKGVVKEEQRAPNGCELIPEEIEIISLAETPLPLDPSEKVRANLDTRLDNRVLDLRRHEIAAIFKIRAHILKRAREFLESKGFIDVHTPRIISTSSEGGTELFPIAYFEKEAFLAQSPQLYKQMLMGAGFEKVYEIAKYFRAEEHNTVFHLNEITAIDVEMSFIESEEDVMHIAEELSYEMIKAAMEMEKELEILKVNLELPEKPYPRITYDKALEILEEHGIKIQQGNDLTTEAERKLGDIMKERGNEIYFIKNYPTEIKPFYTMPSKKNPYYSNSFDLEFRGREIVSGSQRIHDYGMLVESIKKKGLSVNSFEDYLRAFKYGMPPHGGFGLGVERFIMLLLNLGNIREAVLFPRDRNRLRP